MPEPTRPFFSVLMCNYNNAPYIEKAVQSVLNQDFEDWELNLLDDCSTDRSMEIIQELAKKDPRIKVYQNEKNSGYGKSLARNIELATGRYGAILDPDDALTPDALSTMQQALVQNPELAGVYSQTWYCDQNLNPEEVLPHTRTIPQGQTYLEYGRMAMTHFFVFDRERFLAHGNVDTRYRNALDQDWYYKTEEIGPILHIPKPLYYYRVAPTGLSQGIKKRFVTYQDHYKIARHAADRRGWKGARRNRALYRIKTLLHYAEYRHLTEEKNPQAKKALWKSRLYQILLKLNGG